MTMSMVGPYLTTTKYNRKQKASKSKRLAQAQSEHEAWLKSMGVGKTQLPTNKKGERMGLNEIPNYKTGPRMTSDRVAGNGAARESNRYTGTEIMGITLNHKSNYEPVRRDNRQAAIDSAQMRRS
jgi:hypothetical protein